MAQRSYRPCVFAIAAADTLERVREALGHLDVSVRCIDIRRLRRHYGAALADEVLRQVVTGRAPGTPTRPRPPSRSEH